MKAPLNINPRDPDRLLVDQYSDVAVVGLGVMGLSTAKYLSQQGLSVTVYESASESDNMRLLQQKHPKVKLHAAFNMREQAIPQPLIVVSPGVDKSQFALREARKAGAHIIGDIDLFLERNDKPVIAITGSNGKSTVTQLVGDICAQAGLSPLVAGNIGLPVLEALNQHMNYDVAVLELSSFQLESCHDLVADSATILNISDDHLDRHGSMGDYLLAKARILRGAKAVVLPRHDEQLDQITTASSLLTFGPDEPNNDNEYGVMRGPKGRWICKGKQKLMPLADIPIIGMHNVLNVMAAFALVAELDIRVSDVAAAVKAFEGLAHRMQKVCANNGVQWINDSKATNIGAAVAAINSLDGAIIWIGGGQGKGADFKELQSAFQSGVEMAVLIGEDADQIRAAIEGLVECVHADSLEQAVEIAAIQAQAHGNLTVLFSPACASFDMFRNFEHRGESFSKLALKYCANGVARMQGDAA